MNIRIAEDKDLPLIVEIYNQAVAQKGATADLEPYSVSGKRVWFEEHVPDRYPVWVAEEHGRILGWCSLSPHRPGRGALRHTLEISYYVHRDHHREGIGSALIRHALVRAGEMGVRNLFALLLDINTPSIRILEKFGFERWGHMPEAADIHGEICGHLIYGRRLQPEGVRPSGRKDRE